MNTATKINLELNLDLEQLENKYVGRNTIEYWAKNNELFEVEDEEGNHYKIGLLGSIAIEYTPQTYFDPAEEYEVENTLEAHVVEVYDAETGEEIPYDENVEYSIEIQYN